MRKDKRLVGILSLAAATVVVMGASIAVGKQPDNLNPPEIHVTGLPSQSEGENGGTIAVVEGEKVDLTGADASIVDAVKTAEGTYVLTIETTGYNESKPITLQVTYSADAQTVLGYEVVSHGETPGLGANIEGADFKNQFASVALPVYVQGMDMSVFGESTDEQETEQETENEQAAEVLFVDGEYAIETEPASDGSVVRVTMTVENGKIAKMTWDEGKEGAWKSELSANGQYVMKPIWKTQVESMCAYVVENQSTDGLNLTDAGKTDVVAGVSISVNTFADLVNEAIAEANGADGTYEKVKDDAVFVSVTIADGKITAVTWDEKQNGEWKSVLSEQGKYVMKPIWKTQAESMCAYVVENQSTKGLNLNDNGKTDVVAGVSVSVSQFVELADELIAEATVAGAYKDGTYEYVKDDTIYVTLTVEGGKVTNVTWDELQNGEWKSALSEQGKYVMKPIWKTQAESMCAYVVENQSTEGLNLTDAGKTDVVSGVSISVNGFVDLVNEAITEANGADGTYEKVKDDAVFVSVTIADGKITAVTWDEKQNGEWKSVLSEQGKYTMKPIWKTQAESMCAYVVENQSTKGLNLNDSGKTDVVAGVSVSVGTFVEMVDDLLNQAKAVSYTDGVYEVVKDAVHVSVTIENGKITAVTWDEDQNGEWKSALSEQGKYVMKPIWKTQAESMCAYVVENQSTEGLNLTDAGKTDVVAGVSISVNTFVDLVNEAITEANGADGTYEKVKDDAVFVSVTIADGKITAVTWDEKQNGEWKSTLSEQGKYVMKPIWKTQAESMCAYVVENQSTAGLNLNDSGKTDVVSGVSISVGTFVDLVNEALVNAGGTADMIAQEQTKKEEETMEIDATKIDAISGATVSSKAVARAVNNGYLFLRDYVK